MKELNRLLNVKNLVVFVLIISVSIGFVMTVIDIKNKKNFNLKKQSIERDPIAAYCSDKECKLDDYLEYCKWVKDDISAVEFGIKIDDEQMCYYYFEDKDIVNEIMSIMENVTFIGESSNDIANELIVETSWEIRFFKADEEYSIRFSGITSEIDNIDIVRVFSVYSDFRTIGCVGHPDFYWLNESFNNFIKEDVYSGLAEIYKESVKEISKDELEKLRKEKSRNIKDYFMYVHTYDEDINYWDESNEMRTVLIYNFSIKDTTCYLEISKYNEDGSTIEEVRVKPACHDIVSVEVCNASGKKLNFYECSEEELKEFLE